MAQSGLALLIGLAGWQTAKRLYFPAATVLGPMILVGDAGLLTGRSLSDGGPLRGARRQTFIFSIFQLTRMLTVVLVLPIIFWLLLPR